MGYLFSSLRPDDRFYEGWREHHARRQLAILSWALGPIIVVTIAALAPSFYVWIPLGAISLIVVRVLYQRAMKCPCPRCGRSFGGFMSSFFADKCRNCGVLEYSPAEPQTPLNDAVTGLDDKNRSA